ncbi:MAG TPA: SAM-dependent methyltransferase [Candidatus Altiarchaeales archaeon]|nr:SAM-dependent methyltransferase [Candidatus Altiarchaeales archaeon]
MISIVYDVNRYRKILEEWIKRNDIVIELGPHTGKSTVHYLEKTKLTVVVDKSEQSKDYFKNLKSENLKFVKGDVRSFDTIKRVLQITKNCNFLAVDMGGGRYPDTVFKVWAVWSGIFKPKNSIIRNRGLAEFLQKAKIEDKSIKKKFEDSGWLSEWGRAAPYKLKKQLEEFEFWVDV